MERHLHYPARTRNCAHPESKLPEPVVALPLKVPVFGTYLYWLPNAESDPANAWLRQQLLQCQSQRCRGDRVGRLFGHYGAARLAQLRAEFPHAQCDMSTGTVMCCSRWRVTPPSTISRMRECP